MLLTVDILSNYSQLWSYCAFCCNEFATTDLTETVNGWRFCKRCIEYGLTYPPDCYSYDPNTDPF